jgi:putative endonuclease
MTVINNWFVYMILTSDRQVYTGITTNMMKRWQAHASGKTGARYFRGRTPEQLCYLEANHTRSSASQREAAIKALTAKAKRLLIEQSQAQTLELIEQHSLQGLNALPPTGLPQC